MKQTQIPQRLLSLLLALCLVLGYIPVPGHAAENDAAHVADSSTVETVEEAEELNGEEPKVVNATNPTLTITTAAQLADLAAKVNDGTYGVCNVTLGESISLSGYSSWTPIGTEEHPFQGKFDGNGYAIYGLKINAKDLLYAGLFGNISNGGVKDLTVTGSVTVTQTTGSTLASSHIGMVVGRMQDGILYNCNVEGSMNVTGCNSDGTNMPTVGALAGVVNHGVVINCGSSANVTATLPMYVGGLIGQLSAGYDVPMCLLNSYCSGTITCTDAYYAGGLVGFLQDDAVNNYFSGSISGTVSQYMGAVFGAASNSILGADSSSVTFQPLIRYNYYPLSLEMFDGISGCGAMVETLTLEEDSVGAFMDSVNLMDNVRANLDFVNEIIEGHYGYLTSSEWAQLTALFDGASLTAGCWKGINQPLGTCVFSGGTCTDCGYSSDVTGDGTAASPYMIKSAAGLRWFARQVNSGNQSIHGKLMADIDLGGKEWTTMGSTGLYYKTTNYSDKGFQGTFDGNGHVISNFVVKGVSGAEATYGLFGTLSGTVKNLGVDGMTFELNGAKDVRAAGIAGQMLDGSLIENCYTINSTLAPQNYIVGGIAGCNYAGTIRNCYTYNVTVEANSRCGNLVSDTRGDISNSDRPGTVTNCYTDGASVAGTQTGNQVTGCAASVSAERFASGEVAYKLNGGQTSGQRWFQTCGTGLPAFSGSIVYEVNLCTNTTGWRNSTDIHDGNLDNGICSVCNGYEVPELVDGYYQIYNAGHLYWFAKQVKSGKISINGKLVKNIVLNENVLKPDGTLNDGDFRTWTPIGTDFQPYNGIFDGNYKIISGMYINGNDRYIGLFGYVQNAVIKNLGIVDSYLNGNNSVGGVAGSIEYTGTIINCYHSGSISGRDFVGGIAGEALHRTTISNCYNTGLVSSGNTCIGGIVGYGTGTIRNCYNTATVTGTKSDASDIGGVVGCMTGTVENCYNIGSVSGARNVGGVTGTNGCTVSNCYYLTGTAEQGIGSGEDDAVAKSAEEFASGEVAYLLQGDQETHIWGQTIGTAGYPILGGAAVIRYQTGGCSSETYTYGYANSQKDAVITHFEYDNGFCTQCGVYEQPELVDGVYQIINVGQLYWFAQQVNGGDTAINGKLVDNIVVNENVLKEDGTLNEGTFRAWTPIGNESTKYAGTFDGNGKTISGLCVNGSADTYAGLFGYISGGTVQNVGVLDSYFRSTDYVGGVVGFIDSNGAVSNCYNTGSVSGRTYVGGVAGGVANCPVSNCYNTGTISGTKCVGGVAGFIKNNTTASNCYNTGCVSGTEKTGGVVGYVSSSGTVSNCYNLTGTADSDIGMNDGKAEAIAKSEAEFASGEVAYLLGEAFGQTIGTDAYPVLGGAAVYLNQTGGCTEESYTYEYSNSQKNAVTAHGGLDNGFCSICGGYEMPELNAEGVTGVDVILEDAGPSKVQVIKVVREITGMGLKEAKEVVDNCPQTLKEGITKREADEIVAKLEAVGAVVVIECEGAYQISNAGQLYWFAQQVNSGNTDINGKLTADIVINENVLNENGELNEGTFRAWTPIGNDSANYAGVFDGNGKTISGLYVGGGTDDYSGLFGYSNGGTIQNVGVLDSYFGSAGFVGGIVSEIENGTVSNCYNSGTISGGWYAGGVVGYVMNSTVSDCSNAGSVRDGFYIGGVVCYVMECNISNCHNTGNVSGIISSEVGGVGCFVQLSTVSNCYNTGSINGEYSVGGVVGRVLMSTFSNCYNTGDVSGGEYVGGVVGYLEHEDSTVSNCYNIGRVSSNSSYAGSVIGNVFDNVVRNCYYLTGTANSGISVGEGEAAAKTEAEFASGEVAYLLQGEQAEHVWGQTIGADAYPVLDGEKVYKNGNAYSNTCKHLTYEYGICTGCGVESPIAITAQPVSYVGAVNDELSFTVEATGDGLTYQWYFSTDGGNTWGKSGSPGNTTATLKPILRAYRDGYHFYCLITDAEGNQVTTNVVSMTVKASEIIITKQPENVVNAKMNELFEFSVEATGEHLDYRWELSTDGGETWQDSWNGGYNTPNLSVRMAPNRDGNMYRCRITSGLKIVAYSDAVVLDMQDPSVELIGQSDSIYITANETATFTVEAEGTDLSYAWYRSNDKGATWTETYLSGYNTDTLSFVGIAARAAMYMCKITDGSGKVIWSEPVKLQVLSAELKILTQPVSTSCAVDEMVTFHVDAQGDSLKYQWYSFDGVEWKMSYLPGYNTDTFSFKVSAARAAKVYKCVITDAAGNTVETDVVSVNLA